MKNSKIEIPTWEKFCLTVEEAAAYFRIGENKLREIINSDKYADFLLWIGTTVRIKRKLFEAYVEKLNFV